MASTLTYDLVRFCGCLIQNIGEVNLVVGFKDLDLALEINLTYIHIV